jgi:outer membrane protein
MISFAIVFAVGAATPGVITLDDALRTAAQHQPQLMQARANTEVYRARANEARSGLLPQVIGTGSYLRQTNNSTPGAFQGSGLQGASSGSAFAALADGTRVLCVPDSMGNFGASCTAIPAQPPPSPFNNFNFFRFGLNVTQQLYDFGQTIEKYRSAKVTAEAQYAGEININEQVALSVRTSFFNARATKALVQVAKDTLTNQQRHLDQISGFVKVGTRPEIDLAQARTDYANAKVQLITADNNYETAKASLNQAMGVEQSTAYDVADETLPPVDVEDKDVDNLAGEAKKARPDVIALEKQVRAQELAVRSAWGAFGPTINATTTVSDAGADLSNLGWNLSVGVNATWPLFNGLLNVETLKEQKAQLIVAKAQLEQQRQQVRFDVEQARLSVRAAKENIVATTEALTNAQERLRLAEGRYQAGVGNVIELGDAQVALTNAQGQKVQAEYNLATARAQLLKALGRR